MVRNIRPPRGYRARVSSGGGSSIPALITDGLLGDFNMVKGADDQVVYNTAAGGSNAIFGYSGGGFDPTWGTGDNYINFDVGTDQLIEWPSMSVKTDLICMRSVYATGVQNQQAFIIGNGTGWYAFTDLRPVLGAPALETYAPASVDVGDMIYTVDYQGGKFYWGETEAAMAVTGTPTFPDTKPRFFGFGNSGSYPVRPGTRLYYRLCWSTQLTAEQIASQARRVAMIVAARNGVTFGTSNAYTPIVEIGDSTVAGYSNSTDAMKVLRASLTDPVLTIALGFSGLRADQVATKITAIGPTLASKYTATKKVCVIKAGINDLLAGASGATINTRMTSCVTAARAQGFTHVITNTIVGATWDAGQQTARTTANNAMKALSNGEDACADSTGTSIGDSRTSGDVHTYDMSVQAGCIETALGLIGIT